MLSETKLSEHPDRSGKAGSEPAALPATRPAIQAIGLGKQYTLFDHPTDRLKHLLWGRWRPLGRDFWALKDVGFAIQPGEVVGLVGRNGAGKSTLLQMVCGTVSPSTGSLVVQGRVAALLELGAGFNPDFSGLENVYLNGAILGLSRDAVAQRLDDILAFADIGDFIHQPVKTYSSGMFMRLAFSVATSVEPDVLVIDEALSVGDGAFARKSFDRIMRLKEAGKTILFCSHSMYQVEALCARALWIEQGRLKMDGTAHEVTLAYQAALNAEVTSPVNTATLLPSTAVAAPGTARIVNVSAAVDGQPILAPAVSLRSCANDLAITIDFAFDPALPVPWCSNWHFRRQSADCIQCNFGLGRHSSNGPLARPGKRDRVDAQAAFAERPLSRELFSDNGGRYPSVRPGGTSGDSGGLPRRHRAGVCRPAPRMALPLMREDRTTA